MDVRTHRIGEIINKILVDPWPGTDDGHGDDGGDGGNKTLSGGWSGWLPWTSHREQRFEAKKWHWWPRKGPKEGQGEDDDDDDEWNKHGGVPKPEAESNCTDCYKW